MEYHSVWVVVIIFMILSNKLINKYYFTIIYFMDFSKFLYINTTFFMGNSE